MKEFIKESPVNPPKNERPPGLPPRHDDAEAARRIRNLDIDFVIEKVTLSEHYEHKPREVFESLARLVIELEDEIPNYDTLLSDDTSGRLVTRFLREVINKKREALEKSRVQTYFLAGKELASDPEGIKEFIRKKKSSVHKALLVTEYISSGENINQLVEILEQQNINFDVAAVSIRHDISSYIGRRELSDLTKRLRYGATGTAGLFFWDNPITGVTYPDRWWEKSRSTHPVKKHYADREELKRVRDAMKRARHDIKLMAEEISKLIL